MTDFDDIQRMLEIMDKHGHEEFKLELEREPPRRAAQWRGRLPRRGWGNRERLAGARVCARGH